MRPPPGEKGKVGGVLRGSGAPGAERDLQPLQGGLPGRCGHQEQACSPLYEEQRGPPVTLCRV